MKRLFTIVLLLVSATAAATPRSPLVLIGGKIQPIANTDLLSVPGGISTGDLTATGTVALGALTNQMAINGPFIVNATLTDPAYAFGEMFVYNVSGVVPAFPSDLFVQVIHNSAQADTTMHTQHSGGIAIEVTGSRSAGSNDQTNTALEIIAENAQVNEAIRVFAGDTVLSAGNLSVDGSGANIFQTSSTGFIAAIGKLYAENSAGDSAIDITANTTAAIKCRVSPCILDANNASTSYLLAQNNGAGAFGGLKLSGAAGGGSATTTVILSPLAASSVNHGSLGTGSTNIAGTITGIGANTSVVLTFGGGGFTRSFCTANPIANTIPEYIVVAQGSTTVTFSCFNTTLGTAANCNDLVYHCPGQ